MKSYTDLEQSKKLAEILPFESADMCYKCIDDDPYDIVCKPYSEWKEEYKGLLIRGDANVIPCWSLAALLSLIPYNVTFNKAVYRFELVKFSNHWECYHENFGMVSTEIFKADNPVDACVAMIEKLHELNLL